MFNSDGHPFTIKKNKRSFLIVTELTEHMNTKNKTTTYDVGNPGPCLGQAHKRRS